MYAANKNILFNVLTVLITSEKIGEQTGEGGLQAAPVQVLLDTVSSPLDSDHYMHSKMIGTGQI